MDGKDKKKSRKKTDDEKPIDVEIINPPEESTNPEAPTPEAQAPITSTTQLLAEIEKLWKEINLLEKKSEFIHNTNWLMVIVLFVGFLALLFSAFNSSAANEASLTTAIYNATSVVNQLTTEVNLIKGSLKSTSATSSGN